jgi:GntR family transcriptional regulator
VDRKTIRKAILVLVEEGLLTQMQGKGTYISKQKVDYDVNALDNITQMLQRSNVTPSCRVLFQEKRLAGPKYARLLGISEKRFYLSTRSASSWHNEPIALQNTCVPYGIIDSIEEIDFEMHSLYDVLSQHNVKLRRVKETFSFF